MSNQDIYFSDCAYFRGDIPCRPHKETLVHCPDCTQYSPKKGIILIIKLGAIGDVIRTTPLLTRIKADYPNFAIWWLTITPEVVPGFVERVLPFSPDSLLILQATQFEFVFNLDKDAHACALTNLLNAKNKIGYYLQNGKPAPIDAHAKHKFITGIYDDANQSNDKSYLEEIFEICGWKFDGEEYILEVEDDYKWKLRSDKKIIVGLNTGCGERWTSRLWSEEKWKSLINMLIENCLYPVLLGGKSEHSRNLWLEEQTGAQYLGHFPLKRFISLVNQCDVVVTAVTMGLHIAVGLKKQVVLMNNIFNPKEFELYGRGEILQPEKPCTCFFLPTCRNKQYFCMDHLSPESVFTAVKRRVGNFKNSR